MKNKKLRWAGRNSDKDQLRTEIWTALQESGAGIGKIWDSIPNSTLAKNSESRSVRAASFNLRTMHN